MLLLRRLPPPLARQWRANSSLTTSSPPTPPQPPIKTTGRRPFRQDLRGGPGRRIQLEPEHEQTLSSTIPSPEHSPTSTPTTRGRRPTRAPLSRETPRAWNRPVAQGMIPAYDLALGVLKADSARLVEEAEALRVRIVALDKEVVQERKNITERENEEGYELKMAELEQKEVMLEEMHAKLNILQVQSFVNFPWERWTVANAMADMSKPVHRHLVEQKWRKDGDLDLLMERLYQMKVIPDVLPDFRPTVDLHVTARALPKQFHETGKVSVHVEPGAFLKPGQTLEPPKIYPTVFHPEERLYTMLLVDPDVPDEANFGFTTYLHWLKPNIPLSATHGTRISWSDEHTPYVPPHPQRGTPYHRYVLLLLPQPPLSSTGTSTYTRTLAARATPNVPVSEHIDVPRISPEERVNFDVRAFVQRWGLDLTPGGGAHMWREVWDERVSEIYKNVLGAPEPKYGRPKKADPYAEVKRTKKYIL